MSLKSKKKISLIRIRQKKSIWDLKILSRISTRQKILNEEEKIIKNKQTEIKLKKKSSKNMIPSKNTKNMNKKKYRLQPI